MNARVNTNNTSYGGWTALHWTARYNRTDVAQVLIANGTDVNAKNRWIRTPLHTAAMNSHKELVEILIVDGADVNATDENGLAPLWLAEQEGYAEIAEILRKQSTKE